MFTLIPFNTKQNLIESSKKDLFHDMLDDFFTDGWLMQRGLASDTFKIDVQDNEKEYLIFAQLPGVTKEEISLDFVDSRLTISIERSKSFNEEKKNYIHRESRVSSMSRSIYLDNVQTEDIEAKLENGILNITVPKIEKKDDLRKIDIK